MGNLNYIDTLSEQDLTSEEIDAMVMSGELNLRSIGYSHTCRGGKINLPGGWKTMWVGTQGMGNYGDLVIIPGDIRTSKLYGFALEQKARQAGLDSDFASVWASSKVQYKHELLDLIVDVIQKPELIVAYLAYPGYGRGKNRAGWEEEFSVQDGLSAPRQSSLAKIILEFYRKGCINRDIVFTIAEKKQGAMDLISQNINTDLKSDTQKFIDNQSNNTGAKLGDIFPNK